MRSMGTLLSIEAGRDVSTAQSRRSIKDSLVVIGLVLECGAAIFSLAAFRELDIRQLTAQSEGSSDPP